MNVKRLVLGGAIVVAALGAGGVAYAATGDPVPQPGYVTVEDDATTPSPSPSHDCPEKSGGQNQAGNA
ncbi:MAG TPA: hypothetical protein VFI00_12695 [Kribbella sp.]|nr:hypothetical protein [Kribbella sp.]